MFKLQHISARKIRSTKKRFGPAEIATVTVQMTTRSQGLLLNSATAPYQWQIQSLRKGCTPQALQSAKFYNDVSNVYNLWNFIDSSCMHLLRKNM